MYVAMHMLATTMMQLSAVACVKERVAKLFFVKASNMSSD